MLTTVRSSLQVPYILLFPGVGENPEHSGNGEDFVELNLAGKGGNRGNAVGGPAAGAVRLLVWRRFLCHVKQTSEMG